jgi:hypothetical protein
MTAGIPDPDMQQIVEALLEARPREAIELLRAAARKEGLAAEEALAQLEARLANLSPGSVAARQPARGISLGGLAVLVLLLGGAAAAVQYLGSPPPPSAPTAAARPAAPSSGPLNASNPATPVDPAQEQGPPFPTDLAGRWRLRLPAGFEHPAELERVDPDHYRLKTRGVMNGVYQLLGRRLVMETPGDRQQIGMWKFRWQIENENQLVLIGQPDPTYYGGRYLGATLKRAEP